MYLLYLDDSGSVGNADDIVRGDASLFDIIAGRFDAEGGVLHGLIHHVNDEHGCNCFACRQRQSIRRQVSDP